MKKLFFAFACLLGFSNTFAQPEAKKGETEDFRRSSLCLLLVTSQGDEYAKAIEEQFMAMPMPARYNGLNTDVRVLNIKKKATEKRISKALEDSQVAKQLVGKWFNRDYQGRMNMNRIHEWGGYNATFADLKRAENTVRGTAMLSDEGEELIKNTFVMVCDISYYDRKSTGILLAALFQSLGTVAGNYTNDQQLKKQYKELGTTAATASLDIAGFSVNIVSYLYRLEWNDKLRDKMYGSYWIDETTPLAEANQRKAAFDSDRTSFNLEFLGQYRSNAGKTVSESATPDMKLVVREVCADAVDNSINNLAKMFPVFKAKTPFYCENGQIYAYIGTKEGMTAKSKFEIIETEKTKDNGIKYNKVGEVRPTNVWDNKGIYIMNDSIEQLYKGTQFQQKSGRKDICDQGLMLREMGKLGYQYKHHNFYTAIHLGTASVDKSKFEDKIGYLGSDASYTIKPAKDFVYGYDLGWVWNVHSNIGWNPINMTLMGGGESLYLAGTTGVILRTNPFGKKGKWSFFVWPTIGYNIVSSKATVNYSYRRSHYNRTTHRTEYTTEYRSKSVSYNGNGFDWGIKVGVNITEKLLVCFNKTFFHTGCTVGYLF